MVPTPVPCQVVEESSRTHCPSPGKAFRFWSLISFNTIYKQGVGLDQPQGHLLPGTSPEPQKRPRHKPPATGVAAQVHGPGPSPPLSFSFCEAGRAPPALGRLVSHKMGGPPAPQPGHAGSPLARQLCLTPRSCGCAGNSFPFVCPSDPHLLSNCPNSILASRASSLQSCIVS